MRIARYFTVAGRSPYAGVGFAVLVPTTGTGDGSPPFDGPAFEPEIPDHWSQEATEAFERNCLQRTDIPVCLSPVAEDQVPSWLWRRVGDEAALAALPEAQRHGGETSARQVFDRLAGAWTHRGWQCGYFDREADARAFFDEIRFMLCHQMAGPDMAQWRHTGLHWAYGIDTGSDAGCLTDYRTGAVRRAAAEHLPTQGAVINGVGGDIAGEGGVLDLWQREARLLGDGLGSAVNVSHMANRGDATSARQRSLIELLRVGDSAAGIHRNRFARGLPRRMVTVDSDHPQAGKFVAWKGVEQQRAAALASGMGLLERHLGAIEAACRRDRGSGRRSMNPSRNPALKLACLAARRAMIPEHCIGHAVNLVRHGRPVMANLDSDGFPVGSNGAAGHAATHVLRVTDGFMEGAGSGEESAHSRLWQAAAEAAWSSGGTGVLFDGAVHLWHTCAAAGEVRSAAADGDFLFLDDTACSRASINLARLVRDDGRFDAQGLAQAARLWTMVLDISLMMTALPTPRLAARSWDYRPIGLGFTNLGGLLMASGVGYDSDPGRALCAAIASLMTGTAYATSAELASELGAFPAHGDNRAAMLRVIRNHRRAAHGSHAGYGGESWSPVPFRAADCPDRDLAAAAVGVWDEAVRAGAEFGFRNAQVTLVAQQADTGVMMDCASYGIEPDFALVKFEKLPGGGFGRIINRAVPRALAALGYGAAEIDGIVRRAVGHGSLAQAPGINHETLRKRGFDQMALDRLEAALAATLDIADVFNRWVLGLEFCTAMLGFSRHELDDEGFDMLAALGFSAAAVAAANAHCCGTNTLEGASQLKPEHLAVFDCPRPLGERSRRRLSMASLVRMLAAAQPFVSGTVGHKLVMPEAATMDQCRDTLLLGWRLGLKLLMVERDGAADGVAVPSAEEDFSAATMATAAAMLAGHLPQPEAARGGLVVYAGGKAPQSAPQPAPGKNRQQPAAQAPFAPGSGKSEILTIAKLARDLAHRSADDGHKQVNRTCGRDDEATIAPAAETSRRPAPGAARSTASVPSSADAVVEQRHV